MQNFIEEIEQRTPAGIAAAIGRLIASGRLSPGDRMPTVRVLAGDLGVSPATVSHAWQALSAVGLIVSRGRGGTFVRDAPPRWLPTRSQSMIGSVGPARLDLSRGTPDPQLLPALGPALSRVAQRAVTPSYQDVPIIPELLAVLRSEWPYPVEEITIVDGALDAISRCLDAVTRFGDRVIVENPSFPPFFDLLDHLGLERLPVAVDRHGLIPADFAEALKLGPAVVLLQPRAHNPTGASMTAHRAEELAGLVQITTASADTIVIEDDHSAEISIIPDVSLGCWLPGRTLHVRSFSKSHGPDLRMAALGGPAALIDPIVSRRMLGPGWTSRMLQTILHDLLTNGESITQVSEARRIYFARQRALTEALAGFGLDVVQADGINTWLPVQNEHDALVRLAASGIRVAGGSPFLATPYLPNAIFPHAAPSNANTAGPAFIRVTAGALPDDVGPVALALAAAAHPLDSAVHETGARWS